MMRPRKTSGRRRASCPPCGGRLTRPAIATLVAALLALSLFLPSPTAAQEETTRERIERLERTVQELRAKLAERDTAGIAELRRQMEIVLRELEEMRLGREVTVEADTTFFGLAPAASKVYRARPGVSIGGYGELLYESFSGTREDGTPSGATDRFDALRTILYVGYKFNDRLLFNSEIEVEHGTTDEGVGEVSLEFGYLDFLLTDRIGLRAGLLLPPMGFINEQHEPPTFLGTERPETERRIIPSTWRENGIGIFGAARGLDFRAYLINGFDAVGGGSSKASGFGASGLRGGRQKGAKAVAEDFAGVARVDYTRVLGLLVGSSLYYGQAGQNAPSLTRPGETVDARTLIWELHGQYRARGLDLRGLFALADVDDVAELNRIKGLEGAESIGERMLGGYIQAGYDLLHRARTPHQLLPYVRFERLDTQDAVPAGFLADPANDQTILSLGAAWKPIPNFILKTDYQIHESEANTGVDQFNVALGYLF
ncbi:MAG: hypothetical protein ACE5HP_11505 [Gemmatimonadota bacterium]